jgi:hypothetical protein
VERLAAVWCPALLDEGARREEVRSFLGVLDALGELCPFIAAVRLGVCVLPVRGPSRFFGGERALVERLGEATVDLLGPGGARVGVADGLFAAVLAAQAELVVAKGGTPAFLSQWSVTVLHRPELTGTLQRLGVHTLGRFAALPVRHVAARFGADAVACHEVARGVQGELAGLRDPAIARRLAEVQPPVSPTVRQDGFFGGASAAERRAAASLARVQRRLGPAGVLTVSLCGGRDPADRVRATPFDVGDLRRDHGGASGTPGAAPWPGRLPPPSPVLVPDPPPPVELTGAEAPVLVSGRGLLSTEPRRCSVLGGPWQEVEAWAGPWPLHESWWSSHRRRARLQVVTATGTALLLTAERGRWWLAGVYD